MAKVQGNVVNLQGVISEDGSTLLGFSDPTTGGDGVDFPAVGGGSGGFVSSSFTTNLSFDGINKEIPQTAITGATAFTASGSTVGTQINLCLVANGTNVPTFSSSFKEATGSSGFDNTANVKNYYQFVYTNNRIVYSVFQEVGDTGATDITAPTLSSAVVQNVSPTVVAVTFSEALDQTVTQNIADWAVSGHTVSSVAFASSTVINLTVSSAFVYGEAARTVTYTNNANRVKDLAGNAALTSVATSITNNTYTVPSQVTGLTIGVTTSSSQPLTWTAPSANGSAVTDYTVQYSTDNSTWSTFSDGTSTSASATVTGLTASTLYYFRVAAVNAAGTGTYSTSVSATTNASATAPAQVTGLTLGTATDTTQPLTWTAPSDGGSAITDYLIEYKATSSGTWLTFSDGTSTTASTTVTGLTASTSYDYRVSAINAIGTGTASATGTGSTAVAGGVNYVRFSTLNSVTETANGSGWDYLLNANGDYANTANWKIPANTDGYFEFTVDWATIPSGLSVSFHSTNVRTGYNAEFTLYFNIASNFYGVGIANNNPVSTGVLVEAGDILRIGRSGTTGNNVYFEYSKNGGTSFIRQSKAYTYNGDMFPYCADSGANSATVKAIKASSSAVAV